MMTRVEPKTKEVLAQIAQMEAHRGWLLKAQALAQAPVDKGGSPHPSVQVGAILVGADGKEIAKDVNRFAHGLVSDRPERFEDGIRSLWINCAEQMVLLGALRKRADLKGARLYVTLEPCTVCAGLIVEAGIAEVIVPVHSMRAYAKLKNKWKLSIETGRAKLAEAGVRVTTVDLGTPD